MDFELRAADRKSERTERQTLIYFTTVVLKRSLECRTLSIKKKPDKERQ